MPERQPEVDDGSDNTAPLVSGSLFACGREDVVQQRPLDLDRKVEV